MAFFFLLKSIYKYNNNIIKGGVWLADSFYYNVPATCRKELLILQKLNFAVFCKKIKKLATDLKVCAKYTKKILFNLNFFKNKC